MCSQATQGPATQGQKTPLHFACCRGDPKEIIAALQTGVNVNSQDDVRLPTGVQKQHSVSAVSAGNSLSAPLFIARLCTNLTISCPLNRKCARLSTLQQDSTTRRSAGF
eukprot:1076223-Rhodomonas_salina.3